MRRKDRIFSPAFLSSKCPDAVTVKNTQRLYIYIYIAFSCPQESGSCVCVSINVSSDVLARVHYFHSITYYITWNKFDSVHLVVCWSVSLACKASRWKVAWYYDYFHSIGDLDGYDTAYFATTSIVLDWV